MKKISIFLIILVLLPSMILAQDNKKQVEIFILSEKNIYAKQANVRLYVKSNKENLLNQDCFISYHIYDEEKNELLWEGERIPLITDNSKECYVDLTINLNQYKEILKKEKLYIKFDIVDQKEAYWMSSNPEITLVGETITYEHNEIKRILNNYKDVIRKQPITLCANLLVAVGIVGLIIRKKKM